SNAVYGPNDNASGANNVGQGWNREHSLPNSWFGGSSSHTAYTDLFHLYPTDIYVNNQRGNLPFGECANGTRLSNGNIVAKGLKGASTRSGYTGDVFEPDDEYKGDFARSYFYMATCYNDEIANWTQGNLGGTRYPVFTDWTLQMLLEWHRLDPVSQKEIARNEAIYSSEYQGNRNPYIDYPELVEHVWGNKVETPWTPGGSSTTNPALTQPVNGSTVNMGSTTVGNNLSATVTVKGVDLSQVLNVSVSGTGFSAYPSTITAANASNGSNIYVTFRPTAEGTFTGTLTIASSEVSATVTLTATVNASSINAPVATDATGITSTSFTANWNAVSGAQTYTLYVNKKGYVPPTPSATLLLDEDMTSGTTTWTAGGSTYPEDGYLRLGTGSGNGSVTSPLVNLTTSNGVTTVKVTGRYFGSDSGTQMKVSVIDGNENELGSETFTLTATDAVYTAVLTGAASATNRIKIESLVSKKRVLLKHVQVYAGDASGAKAVSESGDENTRTITGITGTSYTVENLTENATYEYKVKAIGATAESDWSNIIEVALANQPQWLQGDVNHDGEVDVRDITALIDVIMNSSVNPEADVNRDGDIDVRDITALIDIIMSL
ncbi:MAG: endonuclease, partial [Muribaculaceae bacterium]|nr:endonuclease [Muribaculaceae bacterium]